MPVYRYFFLSQIVSCAFVAAFVTICPCCSACLPLNKACFYLLVSCCLRLPHHVCLSVCLSVFLFGYLFVCMCLPQSLPVLVLIVFGMSMFCPMLLYSSCFMVGLLCDQLLFSHGEVLVGWFSRLFCG